MIVNLRPTGDHYSLLILLSCIPSGLYDLPLDLLSKHSNGRTLLPTCKHLNLSNGLYADVK